jgi:hypothetical protein
MAIMPKIVDNQDGTKTFTINSSELRLLKNLLTGAIPNFERLLKVTETADVRAVVNFLKAVVA